MPKKLAPIARSNYPNISINCFGFGFGLTIPATKYDDTYVLDHHLPIAKAVVKKLSEFDYEEPRQIACIEEAKDNEFVYIVFDFTPFKVRHPFMGWETHWDYHVVRRELDGTWVHKPGYDDPPCEICTEEDWNAIYEEFGREYVLFASAK